MIKAVLFDLDGTLADTALDLGAALNRLLQKHGLSMQPMEAIRPLASHGASGLIELGTGISKNAPEHAVLRQEFLDEYELCFTEQTVLFTGINELLLSLSERQIKWGIITNKPHRFTDRLVPQLGFKVEPDVVVSGDTTSAPKPSTIPMLFACDQIGVSATDCLYIGDAERDMQAGNNAGMTTVLANWGYIAQTDQPQTWPVNYTIDYAGQILEIIEEINNLYSNN
ncbi:MAG: HAD family hydrolase [Snodgrassella sp.]|nr:HAD family hydrolase [Snodgrassella sp.]